MRKTNLKKSFATPTLIALALVASLIPGLTSRHPASAKSAAGLAVQTTGVVMPKTNIYCLNADNTIFVLTPGATSFTRLVRVTQINGSLIGIDFRVADGNANSIYGLT